MVSNGPISSDWTCDNPTCSARGSSIDASRPDGWKHAFFHFDDCISSVVLCELCSADELNAVTAWKAANCPTNAIELSPTGDGRRAAGLVLFRELTDKPFQDVDHRRWRHSGRKRWKIERNIA